MNDFNDRLNEKAQEIGGLKVELKIMTIKACTMEEENIKFNKTLLFLVGEKNLLEDEFHRKVIELTKKEIMLMNFLNTKTSQEIRKTFYKEEAKPEVS